MEKREPQLGEVKVRLAALVKAVEEVKEVSSSSIDDLLESTVLTDILRASEAVLGEGAKPWAVYEFYRLYIEGASRALLAHREGFPEESPLHRLVEQHGALLTIVLDHFALLAELARLNSYNEAASFLRKLKAVDGHLGKALEYFSWEESVVYPYLERHGVTLPSGVVHSERMRIREARQELLDVAEIPRDRLYRDYVQRLGQVSRALATILLVHFFREVNVVFPEALQVLQSAEWKRMQEEIQELEQCRIVGDFVSSAAGAPSSAGMIIDAHTPVILEHGQLTVEMLSLLLGTVPAELTFVDAEDIVRFYSHREKRFFDRSPDILGRPVQSCHPVETRAAVDELLARLRRGEAVVGYTLEKGKRRISVRYFAVRDKEGRYRGCLEVVEDVTELPDATR